VLDYSFRTYTILVDPVSPHRVTGGMTASAVRAATVDEFTVATVNLERFFDTADDPATSDVAMSAAGFALRLRKASDQIRNWMRTPDIVAVQEVENLATLRAIANEVTLDALAARAPDPAYMAYLIEGNDIGGIDVGFLVKTAGGRTTNVVVTQAGKDTTFVDPVDGSIDILNDRPPLVLTTRVHSPNGKAFAITVINNHLRSLTDIEDPGATGARVRAKRRAQAEFLASLIQTRQAASPIDRIVSVGDYNAFQFNDGYVDVIGTVRGAPTAAAQVVLASPDLVTPDLADLVAAIVPSGRQYSYVFGGSAQELDQVLVTASLLPFVSGIAHARVNADFADVLRGTSRPERLSDHDPVVVYFRTPTP
jgi:predicted extracellular nuclease